MEGDQIILKGYGEVDVGKDHLMKMSTNGRNRDYEREAVEFFEAKLHKFGPELQVCMNLQREQLYRSKAFWDTDLRQRLRYV